MSVIGAVKILSKDIGYTFLFMAIEVQPIKVWCENIKVINLNSKITNLPPVTSYGNSPKNPRKFTSVKFRLFTIKVNLFDTIR